MRSTLVVAIALLAATAHAQQTRVYDKSGRSIGTISRDSAGSEHFRDQSGRSLGTSRTSSEGTTTFYDAQGRVIGRSTKK